MTQTTTVDTPHALGIDRKHLVETRKRFLTINQQRLERTRNGLSYRQHIFLDLLPLLFHVNHPVLPGYVGQDTPAGLSGFKPDKATLRMARQLSRGFHYQPITSRRRSVHALYMMGSIGTIGQSRNSDLDIWVCYDPKLRKNDIAALDEKCRRITQWAHSLGLDACFFPMNAERFKRGETVPLSKESSGSTQHRLLLDEFYRSAIYLGGRYPLWWFVPSHYEQIYDDYVRELLGKRFIRAGDVIDLGGLSQVPMSEYVTAAVWQLYKGIHSPYKSLLKLLLLEVYASQHPSTELLAQRFKARVESGCDDINQLDPYLLVYETLQRYLQAKGEHKRLELVRRCFYFKVDKPLSRSAATQPPSWQRQQLQQLTAEWQWGRHQLKHLDNRRQWGIRQVMSEQRQLVRELLSSYRFQDRRNQEYNHLQTEMQVLGRKLSAAFLRRAGKIAWINPDISPSLEESYLTIMPRQDKDGWKASNRHSFRQTPAEGPLKKAASAMELIIWSYRNQIFTAQTQAQMQVGEQLDYPLNHLLPSLQRWLPVPVEARPEADFERDAYPVSIHICLNLHTSSNLNSSSGSLELDPLNIGSDKTSLLKDVHFTTYNSWGEVEVRSFRDAPLKETVEAYLGIFSPESRAPLPKLTVFCRQGSHAALLKQRLEQLLGQLASCYLAGINPPQSRFVLQEGGQYHNWYYRKGQLQYHLSPTLNQLVSLLGRTQECNNPICIDSQTLKSHPLAAVARLPTSSAIQVAYQIKNGSAYVFILDEKGSLVFYRTHFHDEAALLRPLHQFIRNTLHRQGIMADKYNHFGVYPVEFYRLQQEGSQQPFQTLRRDITTELDGLSIFKITASISTDMHGKPHCRICCGDEFFEQEDDSNDLFEQAARSILKRRRNSERYPCHITDLDLTQWAPQERQTCHYLNFKNELEANLNAALERI